MNKESLHNIRLGLFVIAGTIILIAGLYLIGSNRNIFGKTITLYATFEDVNGLVNGNNVRFAGIKVGTVSAITILNDSTIRVTMTVEKKMNTVIRSNALASIGTDGLMGDKLININPGSPDAPFIENESSLASIPSVDLEEMLRILAVTNRNVMVISANLKTLTDNLNRSRGTLYTVLMDTTIGPKIHHSLDNIAIVSDNIKEVSYDLTGVLTDVQQGKGVIGTLLTDTSVSNDLVKAISEVKTAGEQINTSATAIRQLVEKANSGRGTVSTLINDTATANNLKRSLTNIDSTAQQLPALVEALKHNFLFRAYFKKQEKEKRKAQP